MHSFSGRSHSTRQVFIEYQTAVQLPFATVRSGSESDRAYREDELAVLVRDQPVNALEACALDDTVVSGGVLDQPVARVAVQ